MPIAPRFHRVAALQRPFVNREQVLSDFAAELTRIGTGPRVFNVTGVGGIGKSRLLRELEDRARPRFRTAVIDLQVPALRRQDDALAVLRGQLGKQHVDFDRFDIAYAVLWQRLHPHLRLSKEELSFVEYSSILGDILDHFSPLPVFGTAIGLVKLFERGSTDVRRRRRIRRDPTLQALDGLPNGELSDAVTYLFAEDLRAASASKQSVIIVDSYDALVPAPAYSGRAQLADAWLRDLAGQLDRALVVIASRERLHWESYDPDWASAITTSALDGLPMAARLELLQAGGVSDPAERQLIADASAGLPFYLHLAVDTRQRTGGGMDGALVSQDEILARFLQHVAPEEIRSLEILSPARIFDYDIFRALTAAFHLPGHRLAWDSLTAYSFVYPAGDALRLHQLIRAAVLERLPDATVTQIHTLLSELWDDRAQRSTGTAAARAYREAAYHGLRAGTVTATGLLRYADQAVRRGGHGSAAGIADDLEEWLTSQPSSGGAGDAARALGCLRAEAAVRLGDAAAVAALTGGLPASTAAVDTPVAARLAVAAGHGQRIAGHTQAALDIFTHVWEHAAGPPRLAAGLWAADLHMCQGRFRDAEELAGRARSAHPSGRERIPRRRGPAAPSHLQVRLRLRHREPLPGRGHGLLQGRGQRPGTRQRLHQPRRAARPDQPCRSDHRGRPRRRDPARDRRTPRARQGLHRAGRRPPAPRRTRPGAGRATVSLLLARPGRLPFGPRPCRVLPGCAAYAPRKDRRGPLLAPLGRRGTGRRRRVPDAHPVRGPHAQPPGHRRQRDNVRRTQGSRAGSSRSAAPPNSTPEWANSSTACSVPAPGNQTTFTGRLQPRPARHPATTTTTSS